VPRRLLLPIALIAISFLVAACGGPTDAVDGVASLSTDPADANDGADATDATDAPDHTDDATDATDNTDDTTSGDAPATTLDPEDAMLAFARCMREHGIDVPDPQTAGGEAGGVMIELGDDVDPEDMEAAHEACQPLMNDAVGNFEPPDPEEIERMQEQMLEFAKCMREHGVDFPDPVFSGDGASVQISGGPSMSADDDGMIEAQEACQAELGGDAPFAIAVRPEAP